MMMAKYSIYLPIVDYILFVKHNMDSVFPDAVCFLGLARFLYLLPIMSLIRVRICSGSNFAEMTACFPGSFCVCKIIEWFSSLVSQWK